MKQKIIIGIIFALWAIWFLWTLKCTKEGYEDLDGFHDGKNPKE